MPDGRTASAVRGLVILALCLLAAAPAMAARTDEQQMLDTVREFYGWSLANGKRVLKLEPRLQDVTGTTRFQLDVSTLQPFIAQFMRSGFFAPGFSDAMARYYLRHKIGFEGLDQTAFDQMARDGRGPMMKTEDMDIFFCAQEYRYQQKFIDGMRIKSALVSGDTATAIVVSPLHWETSFDFVKVNGRWRIAGYCVFR